MNAISTGRPTSIAAAEITLQLPLVQAQAEQLHHEAVAHAIALRERRLAHHGHATALDGLVVVVDGERVDVEVRAQIRHAARADGGVLLVIDDVLVDHGVIAGGGCAAAVERPSAAVLEQAHLALCARRMGFHAGKRACQKLADDLVIALLAVVVHLADGAGERLLHAGTCHQRIERSLAGPRLDNTLDVADENVLGLRGKVEYHVGVHRFEIRARVLDALEDLLSAAVLIVAIHLLEQTVVEALHADGHTVHATLQLVEVARDEVVRVRLAGNLLDGERLAARSMVSHSSSSRMVGVPPPM